MFVEIKLEFGAVLASGEGADYDENQHETQGFRIGTQATLVGSDGSHHFRTPASLAQALGVQLVSQQRSKRGVLHAVPQLTWNSRLDYTA